jgi:high-affinity iron transporter
MPLIRRTEPEELAPMIGALVIVFRETIEAGLVIGIVLAVTRSIPGHAAYVAAGGAAGLLGAVIVAFFAGALAAAFEGIGQDVFNASVLAVAVLMLGWHNVWMARHGREMANDLRRVGEEVSHGSRSLFALAAVVAIAVLREGSEVVLFLYGILLSAGEAATSLVVGCLLGLAAGAGVSFLAYAGLLYVPVRHLFRVTGLLIAFMAAGMAARSVGFLEQADLTSWLGKIVWDTSALLPDSSWLGRILQVLVGYTDRPTELQLVVYLATLGTILVIMRLIGPVPQRERPVVAN